MSECPIFCVLLHFISRCLFVCFHHFWSGLGRIDGPQKFESDLDFVQPFEAAYFCWKFLGKTRLDFQHTRQEYHQPIVLAMAQLYLTHLLIKHIVITIDIITALQCYFCNFSTELQYNRNEFLLLCQWLPEDRYALFPIDHPSPPAFQKIYLSLVTCLNTGRSGAQSTWSSVYLYRPSQLAYVAPNTFNVSQITFGPGWIWFPKKKGFDGLEHDYLMMYNFINGLSAAL